MHLRYRNYSPSRPEWFFFHVLAIDHSTVEFQIWRSKKENKLNYTSESKNETVTKNDGDRCIGQTHSSRTRQTPLKISTGHGVRKTITVVSSLLNRAHEPLAVARDQTVLRFRRRHLQRTGRCRHRVVDRYRQRPNLTAAAAAVVTLSRRRVYITLYKRTCTHDKIDKNKDVMRRMINRLISKIEQLSIPQDVIECLARTRTSIRLNNEIASGKK